MIVAGMTALMGMAGCLSDEAGADPDQVDSATVTDELRAAAAVTPSSFHALVNLAYNQCLDAPRATLNEPLKLSPCIGGTTQTWQFLQSGTTWVLQNAWSHLCIEVNNGTARPGERVDAWNCDTASSSERWVQGFRSINGVAYSTFTHVNTNLCLDTVGGAGSQIMQWTCQGNDAQTWFVR